MGTEASKTKLVWDAKTRALLAGEGIDIGCGIDPILPHVRRFDQEHGDANEIERFVPERFDFVFSAHCLEHMRDPRAAIRGWFNLVRPGGHLIVVVPDEDLYEQGAFPSVFNPDHKWTFTLSKPRSWSPRSLNVLELVRTLEGGELVRAEIQDHGYQRELQRRRIGWWGRWMHRQFMRFKRNLTSGPAQARVARVFHALGAAIDQTSIEDGRLAQIQFIVKRRAGGGAP